MYKRQLELPILCSLARKKSDTNDLSLVQHECSQLLLKKSYEEIAANDEKYMCSA